MAAEPGSDRAQDAAQRLYDLAMRYANEAHMSQARLVTAFEAEAARLGGDLGDIVVEDDDDERLTLTSEGHFRGMVRTDDAGSRGAGGPPGWDTLATPGEVVDHYDPVDLFNDLADAIDAAFLDAPGLEAGTDPFAPSPAPRGAAPPRAAGSPAAEPSLDPWLARMPRTVSDPPEETATLTMLRHLHEAGVLSDADYAARKAELEPH